MKTLIKKYKSFEYFYCIVSVIIVSIIGFIRCDVQSIHLLSLMFNHVIIILFIIPGLLGASAGRRSRASTASPSPRRAPPEIGRAHV